MTTGKQPVSELISFFSGPSFVRTDRSEGMACFPHFSALHPRNALMSFPGWAKYFLINCSFNWKKIILKVIFLSLS